MNFTNEQIEMYRDETWGTPRWKSTICTCEVTQASDRIKVKACCYEHVIWSWRVGVAIVESKIQQKQNSLPSNSYKNVLDNYLEWGKGASLSFGYKLGSYQHGKACREWHIKEWKEGISNNLFLPEEFIGTLGCNEENFEGIFGRKIDNEVLTHLGRIC